MPQDTTTDRAAQWSRLLSEAVSRPGMMLAAYNAFHRYSLLNQITAAVQCEQRGLPIGPIATYPAWQAKGRQVQKGQKALTLCMPVTVKGKGDDEGETFTRFVFKPRWFVLAQTEGEEIEPAMPPAWDRALALRSLSIELVPFEHPDGNVQGYAEKRKIAINPLAQLPLKTTFHELGHVTLGHTQEADHADTEATPKNLCEVEAEAVALLCCESLGLEGADYARGYIQHWIGEGNTIPDESARRIFSAADSILKAGAPVAAESEAA
jgi:hypothetical protein